MKQDILEIKRDRKKKMKKNIVAVKSENLNPEDYIFENEKVKTGDVQLLMNEIKTEHGDIRKEKIKQEHEKSMNDLQKEEQKMKQDETEYDDFHLYLSNDDELQ